MQAIVRLEATVMSSSASGAHEGKHKHHAFTWKGICL